jgi:hypothetical protein
MEKARLGQINLMEKKLGQGRDSEYGNCLNHCPYQFAIPDLIKKNLVWYDCLKEIVKGKDDESKASK